MGTAKTDLDQYIADEVRKYEGILVPVKAGPLERRLVKKVDCSKLHPNPDDEFCFPSIGPNYEIISRYEKMLLRYHSFSPDFGEDPLIVEKVHPDGYMILNGHHRWAAAIRTGFKQVPVSIVNLTHETDIETMIRHSKHDRRVAMDLDEVVFCAEDETDAEPPLPHSKYKERIRRGIPALLHYLTKHGYDIWVYTKNYYSIEYIRGYFKKYSVKVDGIVTGTARKSKSDDEAKKRASRLLSDRYLETIHIDRDMVLRTKRDSKDFEEFTVDAEPDGWSYAVLQILKKLKREEGAK